MNLSASNAAATPGVKPSDRDEHSAKTNEPQNITLDTDYSDPDATIASIMRGDFEDEVLEMIAEGKGFEDVPEEALFIINNKKMRPYLQ